MQSSVLLSALMAVAGWVSADWEISLKPAPGTKVVLSDNSYIEYDATSDVLIHRELAGKDRRKYSAAHVVRDSTGAVFAEDRNERHYLGQYGHMQRDATGARSSSTSRLPQSAASEGIVILLAPGDRVELSNGNWLASDGQGSLIVREHSGKLVRVFSQATLCRSSGNVTVRQHAENTLIGRFKSLHVADN